MEDELLLVKFVTALRKDKKGIHDLIGKTQVRNDRPQGIFLDDSFFAYRISPFCICSQILLLRRRAISAILDGSEIFLGKEGKEWVFMISFCIHIHYFLRLH